MVFTPMWTIVKFALQRDVDYRAAFDLLAPAGFRLHRKPREDVREVFPAAVVAPLDGRDTAVVTRAVFEGLLEAGLHPVAVAACHLDAARPALVPAVLAPT
jgi:hypothetical protein